MYLSIYLSVYLSTYLPIYLSTYLPIYLSTSLPLYLSTYLPTYLSIYISILSYPILSYPSIYLSIYLSICVCVSFVDTTIHPFQISPFVGGYPLPISHRPRPIRSLSRPRCPVIIKMPTFVTFSGTRSMGRSASSPVPWENICDFTHSANHGKYPQIMGMMGLWEQKQMFFSLPPVGVGWDTKL